MKEKYGIIYCAYNKINDKRYIGQTIQLLCQRKGDHYKVNDDTHFHRALRKYSKEDWEWKIIDTAYNAEELNDKERYWIQFFDCCNPIKGYNMQVGGQCERQSKEQIRYARDKFVELYSKNNDNIKVHKNIRCIETRQVFKNAAVASKEMNVHHSHIVAAANGKLNSAGGYHWEWCVDISLYPNAIYCVELNKYYLTYNEAYKRDHFSNIYLSRAFKAQGNPCQYAGYTFYRINDSVS